MALHGYSARCERPIPPDVKEELEKFRKEVEPRAEIHRPMYGYGCLVVAPAPGSRPGDSDYGVLRQLDFPDEKYPALARFLDIMVPEMEDPE